MEFMIVCRASDKLLQKSRITAVHGALPMYPLSNKRLLAECLWRRRIRKPMNLAGAVCPSTDGLVVHYLVLDNRHIPLDANTTWRARREMAAGRYKPEARIESSKANLPRSQNEHQALLAVFSRCRRMPFTSP